MALKIAIFAVLAYVLYRFFMNDRTKKKKDERKEKESMVADGTLVKDPVCGAYVDADSAISVRNGNNVIRFCSYECREKYIDELKDQGRIDT